MKFLLIDPVTTARSLPATERRKLRQGIGYPGLGLLTVAALTPPDVAVRYVDESVDDVDVLEEADLVGISVQAPTASYAYELAAAFRRRGVPVVLGGIHASLNPDEAAPHADAVVTGEAESSWPRLVEDFRRGALRPLYRGNGPVDLDLSPTPRRELLRSGAYQIANVIQASKGCPFGCEFCALNVVTGSHPRLRDLARVVEEVRGLAPGTVLFADDNIYASPAYARALFKAMAPLRRRWVAESTWHIAFDAEALALARASGCVGLFLGLDSINGQPRMSKVPGDADAAEVYVAAIRNVRRHGLAVVAAFVFGLDRDDPSVFERSLQVVRKGGADLVNFSVLVPYPGTPIYRRLRSEGRITENDWSRFVSPNVCFEPLGMSARDLAEGTRWAQAEFYSLGNVVRTAADSARRMGWAVGLLVLQVNFAQRRNWGRGSLAGDGDE